jgi:hypothetical protein
MTREIKICHPVVSKGSLYLSLYLFTFFHPAFL